nr:immunoglobulin light chain junction region [Macaca mulatta]
DYYCDSWASSGTRPLF